MAPRIKHVHKAHRSTRLVLEDLPKLAVDVCYLARPPVFKAEKYNEYEQIYQCQPPIEMYKNANSDSEDEEAFEKVIVYDFMEKSPFYKNKTEYINESK